MSLSVMFVSHPKMDEPTETPLGKYGRTFETGFIRSTLTLVKKILDTTSCLHTTITYRVVALGKLAVKSQRQTAL